MKTLINKIILLLLLFSIAIACSEDKGVDTSRSVINIDKGAKLNKFDEYLEKNFTEPYNIKFLYRWKDIESDMNYNLIPAKYDRSIKMAKLMKYLCLDAYEAVAPKGFLQKYFPKMIMLVGSHAFRSDGTKVGGTAESGLKITLYDINHLDVSNKDELFEKYLHIVYHEFSHILHQTVDYTTDFDKISSSEYKSDAWTSSWGRASSSLEKGFISPYASKEPNEDFVEMIAFYITNTNESWEKKIEPAGKEGKAILNKKMSIVKNYLQEVWNIDIEKLRSEIQTRASKLKEQKIDDITL